MICLNKNTNRKQWIFFFLVISIAILMLVSFSMSWWTAYISEARISGASVQIYGYGLRHSLNQLSLYIAEDETPVYQTVLAWIYLAVNIGLILASSVLKDWKGKWLLASVGIAYIAYAAVAVFVVIANRIEELGVSLQGWSTLSTRQGYWGTVSIFSSLQFGYYLAYITGLLCIVLALFRNRIKGNNTNSER